MPTREHQWLVLWAARKMTQDGFDVLGVDGRIPRESARTGLPPPPHVGGVRPDLWGYNSATEQLAFGEAKTEGDIEREHTLSQLRTLARTRLRGSAGRPRLYLAVPHSALARLDRVLAKAGLSGLVDVVRLPIPDILLERGEHA
jgi:hypothetical protein